MDFYGETKEKASSRWMRKMTDPAIPQSASEPAAGANSGKIASIAIWQTLLIALIAGFFVVVWLVAYTWFSNLIWENDFIAANRWTIPVGVIFFSLLVGLVIKYLHAPNLIEGGGATETLAAGTIIGSVCYFFPEMMFSGESSIQANAASASSYEVMMLLLFAVLKPPLLALSFKGGYLGGPIFPCLFTTVMRGLVINQLVPSLSLAICLTCIEVGVVTLVLKAPLTSILLVTVVAGGNATLDGLIVVASVTAMIMGRGFQALMARSSQKVGELA